MSSSPIVEVDHVRLIYPVYSTRAQSIRNAALNLAVGGRMLRDQSDVVMVNALDGVSFELYAGDRLGVLGHNGSGKTTLLKVLTGVYQPDSGAVRVQGEISSMLDVGLGLDIDASGVQNVKTMARMQGFNGRQINDRLEEIIEFSELGGYAQLPMRTYSAGMSARLVFAMATNFDPDVLIMDEWLGAGDVNFLHKARARMNNFVSKSRVVVLASHNRALLDSVCNKLLVLNHGRVAYFGPLEDAPDEIPS